MAEVILENIGKHFDEAAAVTEMNLAVNDGEFVVLLGPTGAGKTTTLRLIAGLERPDNGRIHIGGRDVTSTAPAHRDIAMVFQEYSLYPHYTVYDNLAFPLRSPLRKMPEDKIRARVEQVAGRLRITEKLKNRGTALSGGEMQRVAIGRALVREPAAYLMDEPLSSLDAKLREDLRVELKRIQMDLGATIIYVTHDQIESMTLADRIGVLSNGRLLQVGTPKEIYRKPASTYVACRLGSPSINLVSRKNIREWVSKNALGLGHIPDETQTIGIRPENIILDGKGEPAKVRSVENLGTETVIRLDIGGQELAALAEPGWNFNEEDEVAVSIVPDTAIFFDDSGQRLA